jgi:hypothetical protein
MTKRRWHLLCIALVSGVYLVSAFLPTFETIGARDRTILSGWEVIQYVTKGVFLGPSGLGRGVAMYVQVVLGWMPNPLLAVGLLLLAFRKGLLAFAVGLAATICACLWWLSTLSPYKDFFGIGYVVWLSSMALLAGSGLWVGLSNALARPRADEAIGERRGPATMSSSPE